VIIELNQEEAAAIKTAAVLPGRWAKGIMMKILSVLLLIFVLLGCSGVSTSNAAECKGAKLPEKKLAEIVTAEIKGRGSEFKPNEKNSRFEFAEIGCDHLVRIIYLPETPGAFETFQINREGKVIQAVPGH
jgi:hypothetical protein